MRRTLVVRRWRCFLAGVASLQLLHHDTERRFQSVDALLLPHQRVVELADGQAKRDSRSIRRRSLVSSTGRSSAPMAWVHVREPEHLPAVVAAVVIDAEAAARVRLQGMADAPAGDALHALHGLHLVE